MFPLSRRTRGLVLLASATLTGALLTGCGSTDAATPSPSEAPSASTSPATAVSITDPWIKAADTGMTAAFGTLVNNTDKPLTIVSASSDVSAMELHEMVMKDGKMIMRPKEGGFELPAQGAHELSPGGDHLMLMDVTKPVKPGDEIAITLKLSDGTTIGFTAVGKPFTGAEESYAPDAGMDMSSPHPSA
ncbi:copper chaperone PCu(A)C [Cryptosporangium sp. NPDC051539]|uniref:copper chaperone PCu(A)C n=1 Tax=Cryptosporangium sp. NPDC051539 TaxID=3363962 RepID=UPI0037BDFE28